MLLLQKYDFKADQMLVSSHKDWRCGVWDKNKVQINYYYNNFIVKTDDILSVPEVFFPYRK